MARGGEAIRTGLATCLMLGLLGAGPAFASETAAQNIAELIDAGNFDAARSMLERVALPPTQKLFLQGRLLRKSGRYTPAIAAFREVLRLEPDSLLARQELALTLLLAEKFGPAEFHFRKLMQLDSTPTGQRIYQRYLNKIVAERPMGITASFAIVPSSNINLGTTNTIFSTPFGDFVISSSVQETSGIGVQAGLSGYFRKRFADASSLRLNWQTNALYYPQHPQFSTYSANLTLDYQRRTGKGSWSLAPHARQSWNNGSRNGAIGLKFGMRYRLNEPLTVGLSLNHEYQITQDNPGKSGPFSSASATLRQGINPTLALNYGLTVSASRPESAQRQFNELKVAFGIDKVWQGGLSTSLQISGGYRGFLGDYPSFGAPREDHFAQIQASVQYSRIIIAGFTPKLSCSYQKNASNIAFYDYDATSCNIGVSQNF